MRMRDLLAVLATLLVGVVHFSLQWLGWKVHLEQLALPESIAPFLADDILWKVLSTPVFQFVPRHYQYIHFASLLIVNSLLWSGTIVFGLGGLLRATRWRPRLRPKRDHSLTWADQLVELRRLSDRGKITSEEYRQRREAILSGWDARGQSNAGANAGQPPVPGAPPLPKRRMSA